MHGRAVGKNGAVLNFCKSNAKFYLCVPWKCDKTIYGGKVWSNVSSMSIQNNSFEEMMQGHNRWNKEILHFLIPALFSFQLILIISYQKNGDCVGFHFISVRKIHLQFWKENILLVSCCIPQMNWRYSLQFDIKTCWAWALCLLS